MSYSVPFSPETLEKEIDFTREDYEDKREASEIELVDYDDFLYNCVEQTVGNSKEGNHYEDAVFIANDSYSKL